MSIQPRSFEELLVWSKQSDVEVGIARRNLLCATGLRQAENLDVEEYLGILESWVERVRFQTERHLVTFHKSRATFENSEPLWRMHVLSRVLEVGSN